MKIFIKLALISLFILIPNFCFANEKLEIQVGNDYLITTDKIVTSSFVADNSIATLTPFFTIFNEKNVLLLHPQKVGKTSFTIFSDKSDTIFDLTVKSNKPAEKPVDKPANKPESDFQETTKGDFEIMLFDAPPNLNEVGKVKTKETNTGESK